MDPLLPPKLYYRIAWATYAAGKRKLKCPRPQFPNLPDPPPPNELP